jgi:hypothetical protein
MLVARREQPSVVRESYWAGLPSAGELKELESIQEGLGAKAFRLIENQQSHDHRMQVWGHWTSLGVALASLIAGTFLAYNGHTAGGIGTVGAWSAGTVGLAAASRLPRRKKGSAPSIAGSGGNTSAVPAVE